MNLKNAYWRRMSGPAAGRPGRIGRRVVAKLKAINYTAPICLTAEYSDEHAVDWLIMADHAYAEELLA